jgi:hypothetical protein
LADRVLGLHAYSAQIDARNVDAGSTPSGVFRLGASSLVAGRLPESKVTTPNHDSDAC